MKALGLCSVSSALLVLAGCAGMRGKPTTDPAAAVEQRREAEAKLCQDMIEGQQSVQAFPAVDSETPLQSVKEANDAMGKVIRDVQEAANEVNNPGIRSLQAAYQELQNSVNQVPGGRNTVGDVAPEISSDVEQVRITWDQLYSNLQCGA